MNISMRTVLGITIGHDSSTSASAGQRGSRKVKLVFPNQKAITKIGLHISDTPIYCWLFCTRGYRDPLNRIGTEFILDSKIITIFPTNLYEQLLQAFLEASYSLGIFSFKATL